LRNFLKLRMQTPQMKPIRFTTSLEICTGIFLPQHIFTNKRPTSSHI
jgi:hypothetical protein